MSGAQIIANADEYLAFSRAFHKLPGAIKVKVFSRAARRATKMAETAYIKRAAPRLSLPQKMIRERTTARFNAGGNSSDIVVKSGWISLYKLGATQTSRGVRVRRRGSYKHAFIAKMNSGHSGVFMREGSNRFPIKELFGPNPAHDITNNDQVYLEVMAEVIDRVMAPRVLHELKRLLPG